MEATMSIIKDLYMDDLELILERIPQGSTVIITKEELITTENVFYLETDDTALADEIEDILMDIEREQDDEFEEDFDPDDSFDGLVYEDDDEETDDL
jgi:hypothetical protein